MPELPEVETFRQSLRPHVLGREIEAVWGSGLPLRLPVDGEALASLVRVRIDDLLRTGKNLLFHLSDGRVLLSHLGMSGYYQLVPRDAALLPHTHLRLRLRDAADEVRYVDPRRFGCLQIVPGAEVKATLRLGPDPLSADFTKGGLHEALRASGRDLKALLLDQTVVAGLGNIYVAEALFAAGLRPTRRGAKVTGPAAERLYHAIREVLTGAVSRRGTTLSDGGYVDAQGQAGENQHHLFVYGRGGAPCRRCGGAIRRIVQAGRSTYFCPRCQP